jgi:transposase
VPQEAHQREARARPIGVDGSQLLDWVVAPESPPGLRDLPALEALRRLWLPHYDRCTVPGVAALRWRTRDAPPPAALLIHSPDALEARYRSTREAHGVGSTVHLTDTCEAHQPDRMTQVSTTPAPTQDRVRGPASPHDCAARDVRPGLHVLDGGDVDAELLVTAQTPQQSAVMGPPCGSYRRHRRAGQGDDLQAFVSDWEAQQAPCPHGYTRVNWRPGREGSGEPVMRLRFDGATCRACPTRRACTSAHGAPRPLTVRPQVHHEALQAARQRQETPAFNAQYALRAGVERRLSPGIRRFDRRRSRDIGLARTHLQQLLHATAMHVVRVIAWLGGAPFGERRRKPGHVARLAPHPLSRQAVLC